MIEDAVFPGCPIRNILSKLCDKWSLLVIYTLDKADRRTIRFKELQREIPDIEALYREWGENTGDLVVLGIANPRSDANHQANDVTEDELKAFIAEQGITYPVLMDYTGAFLYRYGVSAFPTTFMIAADGTVFGYVPGMLTADVMDSIVEQTMRGR